MPIQESVRLMQQLLSVTQTQPVLRLDLRCVPVIQTVATGVNAITDTAEMDSAAQVSCIS